MMEPVLKDDGFLENVRHYLEEKQGFRLWWLGQSGYLIQWNKRHILIDPYLSDSLTKKYANTDKPHVRMTAKVISPEKLDFIDVVTSSHNHTDHLDAETLIPLMKINPDLQIILPEANRNFASQRLQCDEDRFIGLNDQETVTIKDIEFVGIPAAHESIEKDEHGQLHHLGYLIRFGEWSIYHSGDTVWHDSIVERLKDQHVDLAISPINGSKPERRVPGNLNGREAVGLARSINARWVIPCHYDMFEFNTVSPDEFISAAEEYSQPYRVLHCGECVTEKDFNLTR